MFWVVLIPPVLCRAWHMSVCNVVRMLFDCSMSTRTWHGNFAFLSFLKKYSFLSFLRVEMENVDVRFSVMLIPRNLKMLTC